MIEVKLSQGAKPGKGGILPAKKVTKEISQIRGIPIYEECISPSSHTAFTSVDEMIDFIEKLADISGLPIGIKSAIGKMDFWEKLAVRMKERKKDTFNLATEETGRSINRKSIKVEKFIGSGFWIVFKSI